MSGPQEERQRTTQAGKLKGEFGNAIRSLKGTGASRGDLVLPETRKSVIFQPQPGPQPVLSAVAVGAPTPQVLSMSMTHSPAALASALGGGGGGGGGGVSASTTSVANDSHLYHENQILREQVSRANAMLARYQERFGLIKGEPLDILPLEQWMANPALMSPLFAAYDERQKEIEEQVKRYKVELDQLRPEVNSLVVENEQLRADLKSQAEISVKRASLAAGSVAGSVRGSTRFMPDEFQEMEERVELLQQENDLISEQLKKAQDELERLRKETALKTHDYVKLSQSHGAAHGELQQVSEERDDLATQLHKCQKQLQKVTGEYETVNAERFRTAEELKSTLKRAQAFEKALQEKSKKLEELQVQQTAERDVIVKETLRSKRTAQEAVTNVADLEKELNDTRLALKLSNRDLEGARAEVETLLRTIKGMEARVHETEKAEIAAASNMRKTQDANEELKLQLDQAQARELYSAKEVERITQKLKTQQGDIQALYESELASIRSQCNVQVTAAKNQVQTLELDVIRLQGNLDKEKREKRALDEQLAQVSKVGPSEIARQSGIVEDLQARVTAAECRRDQALQEIETLTYQNKRQQSERLEADATHQNDVAELQRKIRRLERENDDFSLHQTSLQTQNEQSQRTCRELRKERDESMKKMLAMESFLHKKYEARISDLEAKLNEAHESQQRACQEVESLMSKQDLVGQQWKEEARVSILKMERVLNELKSENARLQSRNDELTQRLEELMYERAANQEERDSARKALFAARSMLDAAQKQAADASTQAAALMAREAEYLQQKKEAFAKLDAVVVAKQRAERERDLAVRRAAEARGPLPAVPSSSAE
eukprot:gnl/Spiro4/21134_TR10313_c1_g1_i1.p1 gnl/Spiro4/21134_TR10313_c1_g1~~gnl/Spiro4/21134_TR10313_c1_g1_i1.p1  ORF type:complete len:862 (+),score=378.47 gnl/Spiro4/21134_TR10313_c1_g1_i1:65-2587(+)